MGTVTGAWYWILTKLRLSRSRTVNPQHVDWVLSGISFAIVQTSTSWHKVSQQAQNRSPHARVVLCLVSPSELEFLCWLVVSLWTHLCFSVAIIHLFSKSYSSGLRCDRGTAADCHLQLLDRQVCSVARLCPDQSFLSWCHWRHVNRHCMLY